MHYLETNYDAADRMERARAAICQAQHRNDATREFEPERSALSPIRRAEVEVEVAEVMAQSAARDYRAACAELRAANRLPKLGYDAADAARIRARRFAAINKARAVMRAEDRTLANARVALDCARIAAEMQEAA